MSKLDRPGFNFTNSVCFGTEKPSRTVPEPTGSMVCAIPTSLEVNADVADIVSIAF